MNKLNRFQDSLFRFFHSDIWHSFTASKITVVASALTVLIILASLFAPWLAPQNPFDPAQLDLMDAYTPPVWEEEGLSNYLLGTDDQGRDMLSALLYGSRISLFVGFASIIFSMTAGVFLGLLAGYFGGFVDTIIMRVADIQVSFPALLVALLISGVAQTMFPNEKYSDIAVWVLILAIGFSSWVPFARTVRGSTLVEKNKEYVQAARVIGRKPLSIMIRHVLPNVMGPVLVIAAIGLATAILTEATLSFLGAGIPPTQPSLGTLIRIGQGYLLSGEWWIVVFPSVLLATLILAVSLFSDWLRDALNPKLR